jgi:hypothetical protein
VAAVAAEVSGARGTPAFTATVLHDPGTAKMIADVHTAAESDNALAADTYLRLLTARLLARHGAATAAGRGTAAGAGVAERARDLLAARLTDPPGLDMLAAEFGTSPFALLRAFKSASGRPPHTWLTG